jgi:hypothetical protein
MLGVRASNVTGREISIHGFGGSCGRNGCVSCDDQYPIVIDPWSSSELTIRVRGPHEAGLAFELTAELYTGVGTREIVISGRS